MKGEGVRMQGGRIDTHQHFFPAVYVDAVGLDVLASQMPNKRAPDWSPERAIDMMDANGIAEGIISVSAGPPLPDPPTLTRKCNDAAADLRRRFPGRFGSFASLPLPDIDASLAEVAYSLDALGADGFIVFTNYGGRYLGDDSFAPLLEELHRRRSTVFIHPTDPPFSTPPIAPSSVIEFPFETTRTALSLLLSGALGRYPGISFILSHAGGALPHLFPRIALSVGMMPGAAERVGDVAHAFRQFYFDTALSGGGAPLAALAQVADPSRILFGTDFPMAPLGAITTFGEALETLEVDGLDRSAVFRGNAARLLGREAATW